jgi:hypothetical protein
MAVTKIRGNTQIMDGTIENDQIAAAAGIETSKLADGADFLQRDGSVALTGNLNANSNTIQNLAAPVNDNDAARKVDVDRAVSGLDVKESVRVATTANVDLSTELEAGDVIDGVTLVAGDRILVKNQTSAEENGIYEASASGAASRSSDADEDAEVTANLFCFVEEGTVNADTGWVLTTDDPIVVDTTELSFTQFSGSGAGDVNNAENVGLGQGIFKQLSGDTLQFYTLGQTAGTVSIAAPASDVIELDITAGSLDNSHLAADADIARSKIAAGSANHVVVNDGSGELSSVATLSIAQGGTNSAAALSNNRVMVSSAGAIVEAAAITANRALVSDANGLPVASAVTDTELGYVSGVTSAIQTQLDAKLEASDFVTREVPSGTINGVNDTFTLAATPVAGSEEVYLNGVLQDSGVSDDYTISGDTITYNTAPQTGDKVLVSYQK